MTLTINCPICEAPLPVRAEYAGLHLHCPHCSATIPVPATAGAPESPAPPITASEYVEEGRPFPRAVSRPDPSAAITDQAPVVARSGPGPRPQGRSYRPCPRCGDEAAVRVTWTPWGSFYGPALLTHVRCRQCGHAYNGKTGRSNALGI
ncbi:MAG TPA: hypothetical protein VEL76_36935, partial [Gemmataceae bacterium]|nr:hypothetical protein [Gemmataceae bacterium]